MNITANQDRESFKPVKIEITIQSKEELDCLKDIINNHAAKSFCNTPYGNMNCSNSAKHVAFAGEFISFLHKSIKDIK